MHVNSCVKYNCSCHSAVTLYVQYLLYMKLEHPLIGTAIRKCVSLNIAIKTLYVGYPAMLASGAMKRQIQLPSLLWICLVSRLVYTDLKYIINQYIFSTCGRKQASFCQASPGSLAVLLQAVQEGWSCLVSCPHRSYIFDTFIHPKEGSSTSVWALSVYSDSLPHFGGVQSICSRKERYI